MRAKHLFEGRTLTQLVYTQEPDSLVWCVTQEGALLSLTYVPEQNCYAWTHHHTQGTFGSLCALADQLWLTVQRAGGKFIERLAAREPQTNPASGVFLDASVSVQFAAPSTQVTGLSHLEGQPVAALADGNVVQGLTVQAGAVELPYAATRVHVGLSYQAQLHTLPIARVLTQQRKYRYVSVCVPVYRSRGGKMGTEEEVFTELVQRESETYNQPIDLKTQTYTVLLAAPHTMSPGVVIQQAEPLPLTVLGIGLTAV